MSAILRKSFTDLTRRRARAFFTVLTLALAVASVGIFAVPALRQKAMDREVATNRLADVSMTMKPLPLDAEQLAALAKLPNIRAVEPRAIFTTRVLVGSRREDARIIGVPNFRKQLAEVVRVKEGTPRAGRLLVEEANYSKGDFTAPAARVITADGSVRSLPVSGQATTLWGSAEWDFTTFYAPRRAVQQIGGFRGYSALAFRLYDAHKSQADRTVTSIRTKLRTYPGFKSFSDLPDIREPGQYPGKEMMESIISILNVITVLALLSALVLLSNTMTTLVGEQTAEIASMKAIGARRREIRSRLGPASRCCHWAPGSTRRRARRSRPRRGGPAAARRTARQRAPTASCGGRRAATPARSPHSPRTTSGASPASSIARSEADARPPGPCRAVGGHLGERAAASGRAGAGCR